MSYINEHITIPSNVDYKNDLDFQYLRDVAQTYIEQLSRKYWTDYNIHDPGITIMETISYAITELALSLDQPMQNIVASKDRNFAKMHEQFKSAKHILTTAPVTGLDYRKLFIDIDGVKNCWISEYKLPLHVECNEDSPKIELSEFTNSDYNTDSFNVKGLYSVLVDFDDDFDKDDVIQAIEELYHQNRNLCEDLAEVKSVPKQCIKVCAEIQLESEANEELVQAKIIQAVTEYLSPKVRFKSLTEMLDSGLPTDQIFHGPVLKNGFITESALEKSELRKSVRLSDIINLIMKIDGVNLIEDISIDNCTPKHEGDECTSTISASSDPWIICVEENHLPVICDQSTLKFKKGFLPIGVNSVQVQEYLNQFEQEEELETSFSYEDLPMPLGKYSEIKYKTFQHHLPDNYGISSYGLPQSATNERRVQAKQLQGYLLFFDQVLSTYFSHLEHVKELLKPDDNLRQTYFFKAVEGIEGVEDLIKNYGKYQNNVELILSDLEAFEDRRNELLNHLISRFAEVFEDYTSAMYKLFGRSKDSIENNILFTKNRFLQHYDTISSERGLAYNYRRSDVWNTNNVSGFQKRIALLSGITNYQRRNLFSRDLFIKTLQRNNGGEIYFEYRWQIKNGSSVVLSSREDFLTKQKAIDNLMLALKYGADSNNYTLRQTNSGKYYVALLKPNGDIIGRQYGSYFTNMNNALDRKISTIEFINSIIFDEGFYVIEHILTLPYKKNQIGDINDCLPLCIDDDCFSCNDLDPFSYQVTIIFPGYTPRFSNIDFRMYMEDLVRRELPAHILPKICWVGHVDGAMSEIVETIEGDQIDYNIVDEDDSYDMLKIQKAWKDFVNSKKRKANNYTASQAKTKELWCALRTMNTIYGSGTLHDCENEETEENKNKIILNRSALGSL